MQEKYNLKSRLLTLLGVRLGIIAYLRRKHRTIRLSDCIELVRTSLDYYTLYDDHRDPNDRLIIAQAISDQIPLISSDRKFSRYERYGLDFIFNER